MPCLLNFVKIFRYCVNDTFFHLVFFQKKFEMNQFTTNNSFQVSENLCPTLYVDTWTVDFAIKVLTYSECPFLKRDALVKAVFFPSFSPAFTQASLFQKGRPWYVKALLQKCCFYLQFYSKPHILLLISRPADGVVSKENGTSLTRWMIMWIRLILELWVLPMV